MAKSKDFPAEILRQHFEIRDGELWRFGYTDTKGRKYPDKEVKLKANLPSGYCMVGCKGRMIYYHRILWIIANGNIPEGKQLDHRNGNKIDNRLENLHLVSHRENQQNQKKHREIGRCGYYWNKQDKKWQAQIKISGKQIYLGYFTDENDAQKMYNIACELLDSYENNKQFRELIKSKITKQEHIPEQYQQHESFQGISEKTNTDKACRLSQSRIGNDLHSL